MLPMFSSCEFKALMTHIAEVCLCVPDYVPDIRTIVNDTTIKGCNFYEHSTCVNYIHYYFDPIVAHCEPGCLEGNYEQARIQVRFSNGQFVTTV